jgi:hypothetical protein
MLTGLDLLECIINRASRKPMKYASDPRVNQRSTDTKVIQRCFYYDNTLKIKGNK